ncbi:MAG: hypothetical protein PHI27_01095 [Eubacteriales bacterium]|nr:hypothetical protein [Eubacteriales bacterium]MDD3880830.1 hypothetical protein [Eubacteriales bacterium]MDD4511803.1 hypothetical protein [Eubacteriales bacterium]
MASDSRELASETVGLLVGFAVGAAVGFEVGALVGFAVGAVVGLTVGAVVGLSVGALVGFAGSGVFTGSASGEPVASQPLPGQAVLPESVSQLSPVQGFLFAHEPLVSPFAAINARFVSQSIWETHTPYSFITHPPAVSVSLTISSCFCRFVVLSLSRLVSHTPLLAYSVPVDYVLVHIGAAFACSGRARASRRLIDTRLMLCFMGFPPL